MRASGRRGGRRGCGRSCRTRASRRRRRRACAGRRSILFFGGGTLADIGKVGTHASLAEQHRSRENVIARRAATVTPFAIDIGRDVIRADLLAVAIEAAVRGINMPAALGHSRFRLGINVGTFFVHLRIEMSDLPIRNDGQSYPRKGERPEKSEKEREKCFHKCASLPSDSTGFKNVGTLAVRPNPKSMRPKLNANT